MILRLALLALLAAGPGMAETVARPAPRPVAAVATVAVPQARPTQANAAVPQARPVQQPVAIAAPGARPETAALTVARPAMRPAAIPGRAAKEPDAVPVLTKPSSLTASPDAAPFAIGERETSIVAGSRALDAAAPYSVVFAKRPMARPRVSTKRAIASAPQRITAPRGVGPICGSADILGTALPRINGRGSCGVADPVRLHSVAGIRVTGTATVNCRTAGALRSWLSNGVRKTLPDLREIRAVSAYACRTRNSRPGAKLSEHAKGNAIDIAGFKLAGGEQISVLKGWRSNKNSRALRTIHRQACGPFKTVLGPEADRFHQDHLHLDVATYRGGAYCR